MEREIKFVELGEICEFQRGLTVSADKQFKEKLEKNFLPLLKIGNMQKTKVVSKNLSWINPYQFSKIDNFYFFPRDISISTRATVGRIGYNDSDEKYILSHNFFKLKPDLERVHPKYFLYVLLNKQKELYSCTYGSPISLLNLSQVKALKIPLPSLKRQEKIANWLDTFTSLERHKKRYQYYLNKLTRGGQLMSQEAETKFVELGEICEFQKGICVHSKKLYDKNIDENLLPWMRIGNVKEEGLSFANSKWVSLADINNFEKFIVWPEEVLVAGSGNTTGKVCINNSERKVLCCGDIFVARPAKDIIVGRYLFYFLKRMHKKLETLKTEGAIPHLLLREVKKLKVPAPDINSQNKIANWLDKFRELTDQSTGKLSREILLLKHQSKYYSNRLINN